MKHSKLWAPPALRRVRIKEKTKLGEYLIADDISAIVSLAQMDVLEIHTWNSVFEDVERPNRIVFDLDPCGLHVRVAARVERSRDQLTPRRTTDAIDSTGVEIEHECDWPLRRPRTRVPCVDLEHVHLRQADDGADVVRDEYSPSFVFSLMRNARSAGAPRASSAS